MARVICLANSPKEQNRCIAGIDCRTGRWVRPVLGVRRRGIPKKVRLVDREEPKLLDVLEIPLADAGPDMGCQPENRLLGGGSWKRLEQMSPQDVFEYCEDDLVILHNHDPSVPADYFEQIPKARWKSLQLVHNTRVEFHGIVGKERIKWHASFRNSAGHVMNLRVTDPIFCQKLEWRLEVSPNCLMTISLTTPWRPPDGSEPARCYKVVAGVIEL
ncbi:MAG: hypothetical protein JXQ73_11150 [Phycisphaerae bacterium]|nr:hypothetical protein [Phycisphaerae bacterium]